MATTPNYGFTVYASTDTSVKFLDFRTSIAGTAASSNFYKIDSLLKTVNDTLDTMDLVTATYSSGNNYTLSISKTKLKRFYTFIVKFSATNSSSTQVTFTTNDSSSPASGPVYIGYTTSLIRADPYQFLPGYYYLCHYNSSNFYILGANSGKQITVKMDATNNEEVLVCKKTSGSSSPAVIETSGMPIGSAGGFATLDSGTRVVQTANNAIECSISNSVKKGNGSSDNNGHPGSWYAPPGMIVPYAGDTEPDGWLLCDGANVSSEKYPDLYAVIGTKYGTGKAGTFNLPDLRNRVPAGVSSTHSLANTIGAESVALVPRNIPAGAMSLAIQSSDTQTGNRNAVPVTWTNKYQFNGNSLVTDSEMGETFQKVSVMQPTIYLNYIIKY